MFWITYWLIVRRQFSVHRKSYIDRYTASRYGYSAVVHTASFIRRASDKASVRIWLGPPTTSWVHGIDGPPSRRLGTQYTVLGLSHSCQSSWPPVHVTTDPVGPACVIVGVPYCRKARIRMTNEHRYDRYEEERTSSGGSAWTPTAIAAATTSFSGHQHLTMQ